MMSGSLRQAAEKLFRNRIIRRRMPSEFGRRPIWVSPDARLRYLKLGNAAFDAELLGYVARYIRTGDTVLDVGSNCGEFALAAAHCTGPDGAVLAVEPDPFLAQLIQATSAEAFNRTVSLTLLSIAVAEKPGFARFLISARGRASSALDACGDADMGGSRHNFMVPVTTVDLIAAAWRPPSFIKIDVEGAEAAVLEGATATLRKHRPRVLIEVRKDKDRVKDIFLSHGYRLFDPALGPDAGSISQCTYDTLAIPAEQVASG